jgi:hypothetical protein
MSTKKSEIDQTLPIPLELSLAPSVNKCPDITFGEILGYFIFGIVVIIFLWIIFFKLNGIQMFKLPFNYSFNGGNNINIYSSEYLKIGE